MHDKTRVLDIKPLRTLLPVFSSGNQAPPLVFAPPFGPFPSGFSPFYPFSLSQSDHHTPPNLTQAQPQPQNPLQHQPQPQNSLQHQPQPQSQPQNPLQHRPQNPPLQQPQSSPQHQSQNPPKHQLQSVLQHQHQPQHPPQHQLQNPPQHHLQSPPQRQLQSSQQHQLQNLSEPSLGTTMWSFGSSGISNGEKEPEGSISKRKTPKKRRKGGNFESGISEAERENGNRKLVMSILMRFDALRRRFAQLEDTKEGFSGIIKRADLRAGSTCMDRGVRTNTKKRFGIVPGVEIGDIFFFRFEICLVGLHSQSMAGIDYLIVKGETEEEPISTSIVSSGYSDNDKTNPDVLIYTGQGGYDEKDKQVYDQKLEKGNLALEKSLRRNCSVRVIRSFRETSHSVKIYIYDGFYDVKELWMEKGKSGHDTFKYKLMRAPGQSPGFAIWTTIHKWKADLSSREGVIRPDITSGVESIPVPLVNQVDTDNGPAYFNYSTRVRYSQSFKLTHPSLGCECGNSCKPGNLNCYCIKKNGGDFPYTGNGVLVSRKPMIYECSPSCPCAPCKNKVTQMGLKVKLEVFKTTNKGWGLRSWDPIRAGSFICIYAGEAKDKSKVQQTMANDDYTFDTTRVYTPFKWNYEHGLADEDSSEEMSEEPEVPLPLIISARNIGNVARFMNHSCSPNVFWQPVSYEYDSQLYLQVAFFAISHIPPMTELTYDYGVSRPSGTRNGDVLCGKKKCFCGSEYCRGSFG